MIDPLFLDDLKAELEHIKAEPVERNRRRRAHEYQDKLASLKFLDPACGSGNFLTETYLSLRRLENEAITLQVKDAGPSLGEEFTPIKVDIHQFYGIKINDFAVATATTALWIAEAQMMMETERIMQIDLDFLPLKSYNNIKEGNALRIDWNEVVPASELNYIMGNPPFVGLSLRTEKQQEDMSSVFEDNNKAGRLDYVAAWYKIASQYIVNTSVECAFVSTNSITQGEQVPILWGDLLCDKGMVINFAYQTFKWSSEASDKAAVHCVIIGFSYAPRKEKILFISGNLRIVQNINGYLVDAPNVILGLRGNAPKGYPRLIQGNKPWDGGFLILSQEERDELISRYPTSSEFVKEFIGSREFINRIPRYCLWLNGVSPVAYRNIPEIMERLHGVTEIRRATKTVAVQKQAETPMLFSQIRQPKSDYIFIPETSSFSRRYVPMGFMSANVIASNSALMAENATIYHFGILTSNVHMSWMRMVCGRLKSDYRYSPSVYNNFPWPTPSDTQKAKIEQTAQGILDARAKYPNCSLADLYDELTMPVELRKAHQENDKAVMEAYGFNWRTMSESDCVAELFKLYQKLTETK